MGAPCVFSCWMLVIIITLPLCILGVVRKKWLLTIVMVLPLGMAVLLFASVIYRSHMSSSPRWVYKQAFGESPAKDVHILESRYIFSTDYIEICLKIRASRVTVDHLIDKVNVRSQKDLKIWKNSDIPAWGKLKPLDSAEFKGHLGFDMPDWFRPLDDSPDILLWARPGGVGYGSSTSMVAYSIRDEILYFYCRGGE